MELYTDRLGLREMSEDDLSDITRILQDQKIYENTLRIPHPYTIDDAREWMRQIEEARAEGKAGWTFGIRLKDTGRFIGCIGLTAMNPHDETEVGYWLDRSFWGSGYMTESLRKVIEFAFAQGAHRVSGCHFTFNPASGRVMQKAGMTMEGIQRESLKKNGQYLDDVRWAILEQDLPKGR